MNFIAIITSFYDYHAELPLRAFLYADAAREWIEDVHRVLCEWNDAGKSDDYVETANLYRVVKSGKCVLVDNFDGLDRGDGFCAGWENECDWQSALTSKEGLHYTCCHTKVRGSKMCRYHKRFNFLSLPSSQKRATKREVLRAAGLLESKSPLDLLPALGGGTLGDLIRVDGEQ